MPYNNKNWIVAILVTFSTCAGAAVGLGQYPSGAESGTLNSSNPAVVQYTTSNSSAFAELEARIAELENARRLEQIAPGSNGQIRDPALGTIEEQTRPAESGDDAAGPIRGWLEGIKDPAITTVEQQTRSAAPKKHWFDRLSIRGYAQFRINEVPWSDEDGASPQYVGDGSVGPNQNFLIRRARLILSGDVSDHMYVYIQPDFAASVPGVADANQFTQLRDCYCDVYLDDQKIHRLRIGQSKVPYGWENLQSSSNRIPLDRNDGLNSAVRNERDLGVLYYYTPEFAQDLFKYVLEKGLKGSGNYGLFGVGVYNGQGGSFREQNEGMHAVARLAVPMQFGNEQVLELGAQAYSGSYTSLTSVIQPQGRAPAVNGGYMDERVAGTLVYYPQPFGFQAEWNVGRGPALNEAQTAIIDLPLTGGYCMLLYRHETACWGTLFPFLRYDYYRGGYKSERNSPYAKIDEWETGVEWQFNPQMELTLGYTMTDRTNTTALAKGESYRQFVGDIIRIQFQMNY